MHKKNCRQFAQHLKLIGNLLESLRISELKKYPETREPLEQLEDALRRSFVLVNSCQDRSYFYLLAMGWNIVYQFRKAQSEIDRYLKIIPLITLVDNARVRERLEMIERDQHEYTLDDEDRKIQHVILKREPSQHDAIVLKKTLSCSYPNMPILILLEVTEAVAANSLPEKTSFAKESKVEQVYVDVSSEKEHYDKNYSRNSEKQEASGSVFQFTVFRFYAFLIIPDVACAVLKYYHQSYMLDLMPVAVRNTSSVSSRRDLLSFKGAQDEWHSDLLGCCSEPLLCLKTMLFPCGTFSRIASVATNRHISPAAACNDLMAYSLILSCCCYTCCIRKKLRGMLNIKGGLFDDFLSHLMCCCCALVQEWREVEFRQVKGPQKTTTCPPTIQYIEY
ncbi:UNVERIFIED_CONTAM: protein MID1-COMPLEMENTING ACTIVITY 1 [Sesamum calycinum]|uniref:Protein MID1-COMPLEMENTING ACTIVITY 1 n=1 Tax=Sesamum calycinum TaxID=2727403 RepID=A0AAW2MMQ0_9LAMI